MNPKLLDHPLISTRYFFPRSSALSDPFMVEVDGAQLACWRSAPPSDRPVLLHFHGNGEVVSDWIDFFSRLGAQLGIDIFLAEYRGYGLSTGSPALYTMLNDLEALSTAIGVPPEKVIVFGRSVGSIYALEWISRFPNTAGAIIESGIHDVHQRLRLRVDPEELGCAEDAFLSVVQQHFNHAQKLANYSKSTLFLHAQNDQLVTVDHARANAMSAQNGQLKVLPFGGHNDILFANMSEYLNALTTFIQSVIK